MGKEIILPTKLTKFERLCKSIELFQAQNEPCRVLIVMADYVEQGSKEVQLQITSSLPEALLPAALQILMSHIQDVEKARKEKAESNPNHQTDENNESGN